MNIKRKPGLFALLLLITLLFGCVRYDVSIPPEVLTAAASTALTEALPTPAPEESFYPGLEKITPENIHRLEEVAQLGTGFIYDVAVSPDESMIAVYTASGIFLYDSETLTEQGFFEISEVGQGNVVVFTPDNGYLIYSTGLFVNFLNLSTGMVDNYFFSYSWPSNIDWNVTDIILSPDGTHLFVTKTAIGTTGLCNQSDKGLTIYDMEDMKGFQIFEKFYCTDAIIDFLDEGLVQLSFVSWGVGFNPIEVYVFDMVSGDVLSTYSLVKSLDGEGVEFRGGELELLPTGEKLLGLRDVYDEEVDRWLYERSGHLHIENWVDEYLILTSGQDQTISLFSRNSTPYRLVIQDPSKSRVINEISYLSASSIVFSQDGDTFATSNGYDVSVFDSETFNLISSVPGISVDDGLRGYYLNSDGSRLILTETDRAIGAAGIVRISVWDTSTNEMVQEFDQEVRFGIRLLPDNVLFMRDEESYLFWDYDIGEIIYAVPAGDHYSIDPIGRGVWVEEGSSSYHVFTLHDYQSGEIVRQLDVESFLLGSFKISPDGSRIILFSRSRPPETMNVDSTSGEFIRSFELEEDSLSYPGIWVGHSEELFLTHYQDAYQLWDIQSGRYLTEIFPEYDFSYIAISPNGSFIAVVGKDGIIRILGVPEEAE